MTGNTISHCHSYLSGAWRRHCCFLLAVFGMLTFMLPAALRAQHHVSPPKDAIKSEVPLWEGLGKAHHPVSTSSAEAQRYFNQGLALIYAFNHPEAARSFRKAVELDPHMAMGWWGLAYSLGPNINEPLAPDNAAEAWAAMRRAAELAEHATPRERAYIEAIQTRYVEKPEPDRKELDRNFAAAMRRLAGTYPDDVDALTLCAESLMNLNPWRLWSPDGGPGENTQEIVRLLEAALDRDPDHLGANHFYVHAVEASPTPARALDSAHRLGALAPGAGHLVHMPAHVYMRTGDYESAVRVNLAAAEADRLYFIRSGVTGTYAAYYAHNWHFASAAYSMQGRYHDTLHTVKRASEIIAPLAREVQVFEPFVSFHYLVEVRFHRWKEILAEPPPADPYPTSKNLYHFARGMAFAAEGNRQAALAEQKAFGEGIRALSPERTYGQNTEAAVMKIAEEILAAKLAQASGDTAASIRHLRAAVAAEDALAYNEPADWYYPPAREALGAMLLRAGQAKEAEEVFREDLRRNRRNGRSLFGLMESLQAQGNPDAASLVRHHYQVAWAKADAPLKLEDLF